MLISAREDPSRQWETRLGGEEVMVTATNMRKSATSIILRRSDTGGIVVNMRGQAMRIRILDAHTVELMPAEV